jgi:hypothetical protein
MPMVIIFNSHLPHSSQTKQVFIQTSQKFSQTKPPPPPPPSPKWRPNSLLSYLHRWAAHVVTITSSVESARTLPNEPGKILVEPVQPNPNMLGRTDKILGYQCLL